MKQTGWRLIVKKVVDRTVAAGLLVATAPVLGIAAAAVRASLGGPVFFRQTRVGLHETTFEVIKLRTMSDARGLDGELLPDEQRLTRLGRFLRTTSRSWSMGTAMAMAIPQSIRKPPRTALTKPINAGSPGVPRSTRQWGAVPPGLTRSASPPRWRNPRGFSAPDDPRCTALRPKSAAQP